MKELSIEQKAKAYEDLLKKAKQYYDTENDVIVLHFLEELFPELVESEDEQIRKEIEQLIQCMHDADPRKERWISWLEKQGENLKQENYKTTICGKDYKCIKNYKVGNCSYSEGNLYHCGRDGYLTDDNGISWSCDVNWCKEYLNEL